MSANLVFDVFFRHQENHTKSPFYFPPDITMLSLKMEGNIAFEWRLAMYVHDTYMVVLRALICPYLSALGLFCATPFAVFCATPFASLRSLASAQTQEVNNLS
jgi:hypothetical protein